VLGTLSSKDPKVLFSCTYSPGDLNLKDGSLSFSFATSAKLYTTLTSKASQVSSCNFWIYWQLLFNV